MLEGGAGRCHQCHRSRPRFLDPQHVRRNQMGRDLVLLAQGWENGTRWAERGACPRASGADCLCSAGTEPTGFPLAGPKRLQPRHAFKGCQGHVQERRVVPERKNTDISLHRHKGGGRRHEFFKLIEDSVADNLFTN